MSSDIREDLIKKTYFTVLYFNCLHRPPTTFEVWRHFLDLSGDFGKVSFLEISKTLEFLKTKKKILTKKGFWVVSGKTPLSDRRIICQKSAFRKTKRAKFWIGFIKKLPFIRGVFITGTLALKTSATGSDWDILVVMKKDRIWLGRLILTGFLFLIGKKRRTGEIRNRFCLNHYLTEKNLIPEKRNEYSACEFGFIYPVFNQKLFNNFARLNWNWQRKFNPNFEVGRGLESSLLIQGSSNFLRDFFEKILEIGGLAEFLNKLCKKFMTERIDNNPRTFKKGAVVIYHDGELAFWPEFKTLDQILEI